MNVAVVGAGVAGLVAAKVLKQDGFKVTVFDKEAEIGGVWVSARAYPGLRTNNPAPTYAYSDFPHADTTDEFPTAAQLRDYFERYARHFSLLEDLCLNTEVISVARHDPPAGSTPGRFRVVTRTNDTGTREAREFDFVVICNGVHSVPHVPKFDGVEGFSGKLLHSSQMPAADGVRGKRVVVVGAGKSALDCASAAGRVADSCTLLFRRPYWMLPRYFGQTRVDRQAFTRWTEMITFPAYHTMPRTERWLRWFGMPLLPLQWLVRKWQCRIIARESNTPGHMVPDRPIHALIYHQGIGPECYALVHQGVVEAKRASIDVFTGGDRIRLDNGQRIEADLVICATGWRQDISFLEPALEQSIRSNGRFRLYRHVLPPGEPRLGFIGYASSGNCPLTFEIAAHWLSQCFRGELALPARPEMEQSIDRVLEWSRRNLPEHDEGHFIGVYTAHYIDWLMNDMGLPSRRCRSTKAEWFGPLHAARYAGLAHERQQRSHVVHS